MHFFFRLDIAPLFGSNFVLTWKLNELSFVCVRISINSQTFFMSSLLTFTYITRDLCKQKFQLRRVFLSRFFLIDILCTFFSTKYLNLDFEGVHKNLKIKLTCMVKVKHIEMIYCLHFEVV